MCGSMTDIRPAAAEIRRGKKIERKKPQGKDTMACPIPYPEGGHKKSPKIAIWALSHNFFGLYLRN